MFRKRLLLWQRKALLHLELQHSSSHDLLVANLVILYRLSVQLYGLDMDAFGCLVFGSNDKVIPVFQMQSGFGEQRRADDVFCRTRIEGIETKT